MSSKSFHNFLRYFPHRHTDRHENIVSLAEAMKQYTVAVSFYLITGIRGWGTWEKVAFDAEGFLLL